MITNMGVSLMIFASTVLSLHLRHCQDSFGEDLLEGIREETEQSCVVLVLDDAAFELLSDLQHVYQNESKINVKMLPKEFRGAIKWKEKVADPSKQLSAFFDQTPKDRACLLPPPKLEPKARALPSLDLVENVMYLNKMCGTYRNLDGSLSSDGRKREYLMENLFSAGDGGSVSFGKSGSIAECQRIKYNPDEESFFNQYLSRSKPVVIEGALSDWSAKEKWTNDFLRAKYGSIRVHVKATPQGVFEGCDEARKFENFGKFTVPSKVLEQLQFPDLVVTRPAVLNISFSEFLDIIEGNGLNMSAYLEYSSISDYFPHLLKDIQELKILSELLDLSSTNIWLSDGNTLGKLHFDPFDNLLCQLSGRKELVLFDPYHNENLYEAHIQEGILDYSKNTGQFRFKNLLDSTAMVMSPVDIEHLDYKRFTKFSSATPMKCVINEGDVLFMPSFWWHEVQSYPGADRRNLAVNFWYDPFYKKEFPCSHCRLQFNEKYRHLLELVSV